MFERTRTCDICAEEIWGEWFTAGDEALCGSCYDGETPIAGTHAFVPSYGICYECEEAWEEDSLRFGRCPDCSDES